jgi:hypothetical protein
MAERKAPAGWKRPRPSAPTKQASQAGQVKSKGMAGGRPRGNQQGVSKEMSKSSQSSAGGAAGNMQRRGGPATEDAIRQTQGSPVQKMAEQSTTEANGGVPTVDSSELYTVEDNETVAGNLDKYTDFNTGLNKRIAQKARDESAGRGLSNSSLSAQGAMGAVLDSAGGFATTDAAAYGNRKTESLRAVTSKYGTDVSADASKYSSDKQLEGTQISADAQKYSSDNQLAGTKLSSAAQVKAAGISANAQVTSAGISASAQTAAAKIGATSREKVAASQEATKNTALQVDLVKTVLNNKSQESIARQQKDADYMLAARNGKRSAKTTSQNAFMTGIANIDQTASPESQQEAYDRLDAQHTSNLKAIDAWGGV